MLTFAAGFTTGALVAIVVVYVDEIIEILTKGIRGG